MRRAHVCAHLPSENPSRKMFKRHRRQKPLSTSTIQNEIGGSIPAGRTTFDKGNAQRNTERMQNRSLQKVVKCTSCKKEFEVVGNGGGFETSRGCTCCYCHEANDVIWPMQGNFFVRGIPEQM
jgi:hypothetical protein